MNLRTGKQTLNTNSNNDDGVLQKLNYPQDILSEIKRKSAGIRMFSQREQSIQDKYRQKEEILLPMIALLAGLDSVYRCPAEKKNHQAIAKAITGGVEELDLPDKSILDVVYCGFQIRERIYLDHVVMVKNPQNVSRNI